jgi:ribosomal protein L24
MKLDDGSELIIHPGDRVEVCEGSWAGRTGTVVDVPEEGEYVDVRFNVVSTKKVKACTLTLSAE